MQNLDLPTGSKRTCPEEADGLKPYPGTLSVHIHACDGGTSSRKPGKVSVMPDLSARGAVLHMEEPERPGDQMDVSDTRTHTPLSIASNLNAPANLSVRSNLPPCVGEPKRLESQMDSSDTCTCMQGVTSDLRRSANMSDMVRNPQNNWQIPN